MMRKVFAIELKRAMKQRRTWIAFLIGCLLAVVHVFHNIAPYAKMWREMAWNLKADLQYPYHLFDQWMGGSVSHLEGFLFFFIVPLLAVLPYSLSFLEDKESGYVKQMYTRAARTDYLAAKFGTIFLMGGLVAAIPLLLNFLFCAMLLPALYPQNLAGTFVNTGVLWYRIYETHPVWYVLIFVVINFVYAGLAATLPLFFSYFSEKKFVVLLMPFVMHVFAYSVSMMLPTPKAQDYAPVYFLHPCYGCPSGWILAGYAVLYMTLGGIIFWKIGRQEDIY